VGLARLAPVLNPSRLGVSRPPNGVLLARLLPCPETP
jgi:hypothetical protein